MADEIREARARAIALAERYKAEIDVLETALVGIRDQCSRPVPSLGAISVLAVRALMAKDRIEQRGP